MKLCPFGTTRDENNQQKLPRGSWVVLESKYTIGTSAVEHVMYAIGWLDKKLKAILCNCGTTLKAVEDSIRRRHRKVERDGEYVTETINLAIPRPQAIFDFFEAFSKIDIHDHLRQGFVEVERYWFTKHWWLRIFQTVFAVTIVNAYLGFRWESIRDGGRDEDIPAIEEFAEKLAYQMIFNPYLAENSGVRTLSSSPFVQISTPSVPPRTQLSQSASTPNRLHEIKTLKSNGLGIRRCKLCNKNSYYYCLTCSNGDYIYALCGFESTNQCSRHHLTVIDD